MRIGMAEVCPGATVGVAGATAGRMLSGQALAASGQALARARGAGIGAVEVMGSTEVLARRAQDEAAAVLAGAPDSLSQRGLDQVMPSYRAVVVPGSGRVAALVLWSPAATNPGEGNARAIAPSWPLASDEGVAAERRASALDRFGAMAQAGHGPSALLIPMSAAALVHPDAADRLLFDIENAGVAAEDVSLLLDARELCATRDLDLLASLRRLAGVGLTVSLDVPGRLDALPLLGVSDLVPTFVRLSASSFCRSGPVDPVGAALALARHFGAQPILHGEVDAALATRARRERILIEDPSRPIEASEIASHLARVGCADRAPWDGPARAPARWRRHA
jgi:hypothetical protein